MTAIERVWFATFGESIGSKKKSGPGQVRVLCPFHQERNPSCDVSLEKNVFVCRSCGASGGYLDVPILAGNARDRREAAQWLERRGVRL